MFLWRERLNWLQQVTNALSGLWLLTIMLSIKFTVKTSSQNKNVCLWRNPELIYESKNVPSTWKLTPLQIQSGLRGAPCGAGTGCTNENQPESGSLGRPAALSPSNKSDPFSSSKTSTRTVPEKTETRGLNNIKYSSLQCHVRSRGCVLRREKITRTFNGKMQTRNE